MLGAAGAMAAQASTTTSLPSVLLDAASSDAMHSAAVALRPLALRVHITPFCNPHQIFDEARAIEPEPLTVSSGGQTSHGARGGGVSNNSGAHHRGTAGAGGVGSGSSGGLNSGPGILATSGPGGPSATAQGGSVSPPLSAPTGASASTQGRGGGVSGSGHFPDVTGSAASRRYAASPPTSFDHQPSASATGAVGNVSGSFGNEAAAAAATTRFDPAAVVDAVLAVDLPHATEATTPLGFGLTVADAAATDGLQHLVLFTKGPPPALQRRLYARQVRDAARHRDRFALDDDITTGYDPTTGLPCTRPTPAAIAGGVAAAAGDNIVVTVVLTFRATLPAAQLAVFPATREELQARRHALETARQKPQRAVVDREENIGDNDGGFRSLRAGASFFERRGPATASVSFNESPTASASTYAPSDAMIAAMAAQANVNAARDRSFGNGSRVLTDPLSPAISPPAPTAANGGRRRGSQSATRTTSAGTGAGARATVPPAAATARDMDAEAARPFEVWLRQPQLLRSIVHASAAAVPDDVECVDKARVEVEAQVAKTVRTLLAVTGGRCKGAAFVLPPMFPGNATSLEMQLTSLKQQTTPAAPSTPKNATKTASSSRATKPRRASHDPHTASALDVTGPGLDSAGTSSHSPPPGMGLMVGSSSGVVGAGAGLGPHQGSSGSLAPSVAASPLCPAPLGPLGATSAASNPSAVPSPGSAALAAGSNVGAGATPEPAVSVVTSVACKTALDTQAKVNAKVISDLLGLGHHVLPTALAACFALSANESTAVQRRAMETALGLQHTIAGDVGILDENEILTLREVAIFSQHDRADAAADADAAHHHTANGGDVFGSGHGVSGTGGYGTPPQSMREFALPPNGGAHSFAGPSAVDNDLHERLLSAAPARSLNVSFTGGGHAARVDREAREAQEQRRREEAAMDLLESRLLCGFAEATPATRIIIAARRDTGGLLCALCSLFFRPPRLSDEELDLAATAAATAEFTKDALMHGDLLGARVPGGPRSSFDAAAASPVSLPGALAPAPVGSVVGTDTAGLMSGVRGSASLLAGTAAEALFAVRAHDPAECTAPVVWCDPGHVLPGCPVPDSMFVADPGAAARVLVMHVDEKDFKAFLHTRPAYDAAAGVCPPPATCVPFHAPTAMRARVERWQKMRTPDPLRHIEALRSDVAHAGLRHHIRLCGVALEQYETSFGVTLPGIDCHSEFQFVSEPSAVMSTSDRDRSRTAPPPGLVRLSPPGGPVGLDHSVGPTSVATPRRGSQPASPLQLPSPVERRRGDSSLAVTANSQPMADRQLHLQEPEASAAAGGERAHDGSVGPQAQGVEGVEEDPATEVSSDFLGFPDALFYSLVVGSPLLAQCQTVKSAATVCDDIQASAGGGGPSVSGSLATPQAAPTAPQEMPDRFSLV